MTHSPMGRACLANPMGRLRATPALFKAYPQSGHIRAMVGYARYDDSG